MNNILYNFISQQLVHCSPVESLPVIRHHILVQSESKLEFSEPFFQPLRKRKRKTDISSKSNKDSLPAILIFQLWFSNSYAILRLR